MPWQSAVLVMVPVVVIVGCEVEVRLVEDGVVSDDVVSVVDVAKLVSVEGKLALLENLIHVAVLSS